MVKHIIKRLIISLLASVFLLIIGFIVAFLISKYNNFNINNTLFVEGILTIIIGLFSMMEGNPSGLGIWGLNNLNAQYNSYMNLEVTRMERESTNFFRNFKNNSIVRTSLSGFAIVFGGVLIVLTGVFIR